ncbi:hypothetical protein CEJ87_17640 [Caldifermentibacillus hisashii]|nr:hypothetical protein CEJ87_17640 [Caldifermentibacillus hisashii]
MNLKCIQNKEGKSGKRVLINGARNFPRGRFYWAIFRKKSTELSKRAALLDNFFLKKVRNCPVKSLYWTIFLPKARNCPIEGFSWTKKEVNQEKLSNRTVLMDKMEAQSGKTVQ